jgi:hypothetical protein
MMAQDLICRRNRIAKFRTGICKSVFSPGDANSHPVTQNGTLFPVQQISTRHTANWNPQLA